MVVVFFCVLFFVMVAGQGRAGQGCMNCAALFFFCFLFFLITFIFLSFGGGLV